MGITLTGSGEKDYLFPQTAKKGTVKLTVIKKFNANAAIKSFLGEQTIKGTPICTGVVYSWYCDPGKTNTLTNAPSSAYGYTMGAPGTPPGNIEIDFSYKPYVTAPAAIKPAAVSTSEGPTLEEWTSKRVILDEGLWVQVKDTGQLSIGKPLSKFPEIIDVLISDEESAARIGKNIIWESVKKREGFFPFAFNPLIQPGDFIQTSHSEQNINNWKCRVQRISFNMTPTKQICKYYIKEKGNIEGE